MNINVRLLDTDSDLKKWFNAVATSGMDVNFLIDKALQSFIGRTPITLGYISTSNNEDEYSLRDTDVLVEVENVEYTAYIRKQSVHGNGAHIIKHAIRQTLVFHSGATRIPTKEQLEPEQEIKDIEINLNNNVYILDMSSNKLKVPIKAYLDLLKGTIDFKSIKTDVFLENLIKVIQSSNVKEELLDKENSSDNEIQEKSIQVETLDKDLVEIKVANIDQIQEIFIEDDLQEIEPLSLVKVQPNAPSTLFYRHIIKSCDL